MDRITFVPLFCIFFPRVLFLWEYFFHCLFAVFFCLFFFFFDEVWRTLTREVTLHKRKTFLIHLHLRCFFSEAALQGCSYKKVFWEYAANLQEKNACRNVISIKHQNNFIEIKHLLHIFRTLFPENTSEKLLLFFIFNFYVTRALFLILEI